MQIAYAGTNLTIHCNSYTMPRWFKDGIEIKSRKGGQLYIFFTKVTEKDSGVYYCQGTYVNNDYFNVSSHLFVGGENHAPFEVKFIQDIIFLGDFFLRIYFFEF